jgi:hypothetical protein
MKQTAVEFLIKAFQGAYGDKVINVVSVQVKEAKAMEKEQIIQAYHQNGWNDNDNEHNAEQYYNETYKQD